MNNIPKFEEEYSSKIPALALLSNLGWTFLSPKQALQARANKTNEVVLRDVLRAELKKRRFMYAGKSYPLSKSAIDKIIKEVCYPALNEGLSAANERFYMHLLYGISVIEFVNGKKANPTIALIDWQNVANNSFLFTEELTVKCSNGIDTRRPDLVCFVNGLPLVVIEAKRPDGHTNKAPTVEAGISQSLRNQRADEIPYLFVYNQLILSISGIDGRYATQGTATKFWAAWREEDLNDLELFEVKNKKLNAVQKNALFDHRKAKERAWYEALIGGGELAVTEQDKLLIGLLSLDRLFDMIRLFTFFDSKIGKVVARYHQVFSIKRLLERINTKNDQGGREGGVIWHTTGSGKSFTMVLLSKGMFFDNGEIIWVLILDTTVLSPINCDWVLLFVIVV